MSDGLVTKAMLDRRVAALLGLNQALVSQVTATFLHAMQDELVELRKVQLTRFGSLRVVTRRGQVDQLKPIAGHPLTVTSQKKYHVSFKKAPLFTRAVRERYRDTVVEDQMDKYGVDEAGAENEKKASQGCPECGAKAERHGNVLACPTHGTEPFETKTK